MYDPALSDGANPTASAPIAPDGRPQFGRRYPLPARQGRAVRLENGDELILVTPHGSQVCDFFALAEDAPAEFLSMEHSRTALGRAFVRTGDALVSNRRRPLVAIVEDTSPGVHDTLIAACDQPRYEGLGCAGYHDNCADNFRMSLAAIGVTPVHVPCPFNVWMNVPIASDGALCWAPPVSRPDDRLRLRALAPIIAVMSACPQDMTPVNGAAARPTDLAFEVHRPADRARRNAPRPALKQFHIGDTSGPTH